MITQSEIIIDTTDGTTRSVTERHTFDDTATYLYSYLTDMNMDVNLAMSLRADNMNAAIAAKEAAVAEAMNFEIPLFKSEFRDLFTATEQTNVSKFNATYQSHPLLTEQQKDDIRAGLDYYNDAGRVYLSNPKTIAFVTMYEALGVIDAGRAAVILNG